MTAPFSAVIQRHRWVHVHPSAHAEIAASCSDRALRAAVADWLARGLPLVSRARQPYDAPLAHPLGLCLKGERGNLSARLGKALPLPERHRVALAVKATGIVAVEEAPKLSDVAEILPSAAAAAALALCGRARSLGFEARAFGSAAWQHRTGDVYLDSGSDLDIVAAPSTREALGGWLGFLRELEPASPMRFDGEVELPSGEAANWRELAGDPREVLLKSCHGARLASTRSVWELFE